MKDRRNFDEARQFEQTIDQIIVIAFMVLAAAVALRLVWEASAARQALTFERVITPNMQTILDNNQIILNSPELAAFASGFHTPTGWTPQPPSSGGGIDTPSMCVCP